LIDTTITTILFGCFWQEDETNANAIKSKESHGAIKEALLSGLDTGNCAVVFLPVSRCHQACL